MAVTIKIPYNKYVDDIEILCTHKISPRSFYIHNKLGGKGWAIYKSGKDLFLTIDDDELATLIKLLL